ncbi:MAG: sulfotransferase [Planctomycetota bacterium]
MSKLAFLLSSERSGSNLMRVILDSHRDYSAPHSPHLIKTFVPLLANYGDLRSKDNLAQLANDMRKVVEIQLRSWPFIPTTEQIIKRTECASFAGLMEAIYGLAAEQDGKSKSFIKDNGCMPLAPEIVTLFPNAKFVYLVRDARDVALSWKKSPGHPGGVKQAARMWLSEQTDAIYFLSMIAHRGNVIVVAYEDLVSNPHREIERICEHLQIQFDENMLKFYQGKEAKTSAEAAVGWKNLVKPILSENIGKYKIELSRKEIRKIEKISALPLLQLGYELDFALTMPWFDPSIVGKLYRAGRVALKQLMRGREGLEELKKRTSRLSGLREIINRKQNDHPKWFQPQSKSNGQLLSRSGIKNELDD